MTPDNNKFSTELCKACELSLFAWARGRKKEPSRPSLKAECILNAEFQRIARRDKKAFLRDQGKETEKKKKNRMGKTRDLFKKIRDTKGTFHAKMGTIKDRNSMHLTEAEDTKKRR